MEYLETLYKNFITQMNVLRRLIASLLIDGNSDHLTDISDVVKLVDETIDQANLGTSWMSQDLLKISQLLLKCKDEVNMVEENSSNAWKDSWSIIHSTAEKLCENMDDELALQVKELSAHEIG